MPLSPVPLSLNKYIKMAVTIKPSKVSKLVVNKLLFLGRDLLSYVLELSYKIISSKCYIEMYLINLLLMPLEQNTGNVFAFRLLLYI